MVPYYLKNKSLNRFRFFDIQKDGDHAGVVPGGLVQDVFTPPRDDDFIAERVEGFGEASANAGTAARDQNGITSEFHAALKVDNENIVVKGNMLHSGSEKCKLVLMKVLPRPYHHGNLREALLKAAERALEDGGLQSMSLRELSRELGVTHASPRRHFADKQDLIDALAVRGFERMDAILSRAAKNNGQVFKTRLTKFARAYVGFALKHPALCGLMFDAKHRPGAPKELLQASEKAFSHGRALFADGQASGEVVEGDPNRLALVAYASLQGLISISTDGKFKGISLDTLVPEIMDRIILGLSPRN
jgi:AcrR family transcriptional regulator